MTTTSTEASTLRNRLPTLGARTLDGGLVLVVMLVLVLLMVPSTVVPAGPLRSNGSPAVLLSLGLGVLLALSLATGRPGPAHYLLNGGVLAAVSSAALLTVVWANGQLTPLAPLVEAAATRSMIRLIGYTSVALTVIWVARSRRQRFAVVVALVVGLSYCAVIGILQARAGIDGRYWLQPPGFVLNREFAPAARAGYTRALGTTDSPIEFAVLMSCLLALALLVLRAARSPGVRSIGLIGLVLAPVALLDSLSRTAVVTAAGVLIVYLISLSLGRTLLAVVAFGMVVAALYALDPARVDTTIDLVVNASSDSSVTSRTDDYTYVGESFRASPFFGQGPGTQLPESSRYIDNHWLQAVLQGGVLGVISYVFVFVGGILAALGPFRSQAHKTECVGYLAVMVAVALSAFTFDLFAFNQARLIFFIAFGLAWAARADLGFGPVSDAGMSVPATASTGVRL